MHTLISSCLVAALVVPSCTSPTPDPPPRRGFSTNDPEERACALDKTWLTRIWRGHHPAHSEDVTTVPYAPNYSGSFTVTSHSGPWDYLQQVPLVLYGPRRIRASGAPLQDPASITDVYATVGELTDVGLDPRRGAVLRSALTGRSVPPKLVMVVVWDGVGRNVLERWPDAWPTLARLERDGTSFLNATVGSSPSITPATHSTLGTGEYPRAHGVTAIEYRTHGGKARQAFADRNPADLALSTFADQVDVAYENRSLVGMVAWKSWHLGMLGHGTQHPGGDPDHLALIGPDGTVSGNPAFFSTPGHLTVNSTLERRARELDRADGVSDGETMGHPILEMHDNPAWARFETDLLLRLMRREGYGRDAIPDILVTNYKVTDIVSHRYNMDSREMEVALRAQDDDLGRLVDYLDREVEDYVLIVTADHGNTPPPGRTGAWPIQQGQLEDDVNERFGNGAVTDIVKTTSAAGPFLDREAMRELGITSTDVARFLNGYTISDNWRDPELPAGYDDRADEPIFEAAFAGSTLPDILSCAFGDATPPED